MLRPVGQISKIETFHVLVPRPTFLEVRVGHKEPTGLSTENCGAKWTLWSFLNASFGALGCYTE
jgi:hypothetical protein